MAKCMHKSINILYKNDLINGKTWSESQILYFIQKREYFSGVKNYTQNFCNKIMAFLCLSSACAFLHVWFIDIQYINVIKLNGFLIHFWWYYIVLYHSLCIFFCFCTMTENSCTILCNIAEWEMRWMIKRTFGILLGERFERVFYVIRIL